MGVEAPGGQGVEKRAYSTYVSAEQRRPQGCIGGQICVVILARALRALASAPALRFRTPAGPPLLRLPTTPLLFFLSSPRARSLGGPRNARPPFIFRVDPVFFGAARLLD